MEQTTVKELKKFLKAEAKRLQSDWEDVPEWMIDSAVKFFNAKVNDPEKQIIRRLQEVTCPNDGEQNNEEIIEFLREANENTLDEQAHGFEFKDKTGKTIEIIMWENCDHFTLRNLYEHIGI